MGFFLPLIIWIGGFGWFSRKYKNRVADWVIARWGHRPRYLNYFLLGSIAIIIEELLTCQPIISTGCLPTTFPVFHLMLAVLYAVWKFTRINPRWLLWLFGLWGAYGEMIVVGRQETLRQMFPDQPHLVPMFWILSVAIYIIIASIPITYADRDRKLKS